MAVFEGVGVALVTLFGEDGELDAAGTAEHAARLAEAGVRAVLVAGTTGEAVALEREERRALLGAVRAAVPSDVAVIAGTGAATGRQAAVLTVDAVASGADAVLVLSPPRVPDPRPYFDTVAAAAGDRPLLAYHFPAVAPPGIPVELLGELPIAGVKDSSGDPGRLLHELDTFQGDVWSGSSALVGYAAAVGAAGVLLAAANAEPELCVRAWAGDAAAQRELRSTHEGVAADFPHGVKGLTAKRWGTSSVARLGR